MPNTNCLQGLRCPECHDEGPFNMEVSVWTVMSDEGMGDAVQPDWDEDSPCMCMECKHSGTVADFREKNDER